ncbi:MAG: relaxase/mobilization nuclease domain-containing protein [Deltaproteobacteria bacterium]|jgi:hypothetical protein|nr:relaxase/mobilization nuclease domain-containing protein [Deltaproteobacteria bacterium]
MIGNITRGTDFYPLLKYLLGPDRDPEIVCGTATEEDVESLCAEFRAVAALKKRIANRVWHCSLSLADGEEAGKDVWCQIVARFMELMGFGDGALYKAVRHRNAGHDHVHIAACRVARDGRLWRDSYDKRRCVRACGRLEEEFRLKIVPRLEGAPRRRQLSDGERWLSWRTGRAPGKVGIQEAVDAYFECAAADGLRTDLPSFMYSLAEIGIETRLELGGSGTAYGISFRLPESAPRPGHSLGTDYSWGGLLARGLDYDPGRDLETLRETFGVKPAGRAVVREEIEAVLKGVPPGRRITVSEFAGRLLARGVTMVIGLPYVGRFPSLSYARGGLALDAADLGTGYDLKSLAARALTYGNDDLDELKRIKDGFRLPAKPFPADVAVREGVPLRRALEETILHVTGGGPLPLPLFMDRMREQGAEVFPNVKETGQVIGLRFEVDGSAMKGSEIGDRFKWMGLVRGNRVSYDPDRDLAGVRERMGGRQKPGAAPAPEAERPEVLREPSSEKSPEPEVKATDAAGAPEAAPSEGARAPSVGQSPGPEAEGAAAPADVGIVAGYPPIVRSVLGGGTLKEALRESVARVLERKEKGALPLLRFMRLMEEEGARTVLKFNGTGGIVGISFQAGLTLVNGSEVSRGYGWGGLARLGVRDDPGDRAEVEALVSARAGEARRYPPIVVNVLGGAGLADAVRASAEKAARALARGDGTVPFAAFAAAMEKEGARVARKFDGDGRFAGISFAVGETVTDVTWPVMGSGLRVVFGKETDHVAGQCGAAEERVPHGQAAGGARGGDTEDAGGHGQAAGGARGGDGDDAGGIGRHRETAGGPDESGEGGPEGSLAQGARGGDAEDAGGPGPHRGAAGDPHERGEGAPGNHPDGPYARNPERDGGEGRGRGPGAEARGEPGEAHGGDAEDAGGHGERPDAGGAPDGSRAGAEADAGDGRRPVGHGHRDDGERRVIAPGAEADAERRGLHGATGEEPRDRSGQESGAVPDAVLLAGLRQKHRHEPGEGPGGVPGVEGDESADARGRAPGGRRAESHEGGEGHHGQGLRREVGRIRPGFAAERHGERPGIVPHGDRGDVAGPEDIRRLIGGGEGEAVAPRPVPEPDRFRFPELGCHEMREGMASYRLDGRPGPSFVDLGDEIAVMGDTEDELLAALMLGQTRWGAVKVSGGAPFLNACMSLAESGAVNIVMTPEIFGALDACGLRMRDGLPVAAGGHGKRRRAQVYFACGFRDADDDGTVRDGLLRMAGGRKSLTLCAPPGIVERLRRLARGCGLRIKAYVLRSLEIAKAAGIRLVFRPAVRRFLARHVMPLDREPVPSPAPRPEPEAGESPRPVPRPEPENLPEPEQDPEPEPRKAPPPDPEPEWDYGPSFRWTELTPLADDVDLGPDPVPVPEPQEDVRPMPVPMPEPKPTPSPEPPRPPEPRWRPRGPRMG